MPLVDFVIITALTEEFNAVKQALSPAGLETDSSGAQVWFRTTVVNKTVSRKYHVVVAFQTQMGAFDAISLTNDAIHRWKPAYVIMTGIAGTFDEKWVRLGDVVVSQQIFYYDMGKAVGVKKQTKINYRPQGYPCSVTLIRQAELLAVSQIQWQKKGQQSAKKMDQRLNANAGAKAIAAPKAKIKKLEEHKSTVHFGTMASGSLVVASVKKKQELLQLHGKILATEMEGAGVLHQAYYQEPTIPAIVIKGISDAADEKKTKTDKEGHWRSLALQNASNFVVELIRQGRFPALHTDEFDLGSERGGTAMARQRINRPVTPGASFFSFPFLVVPRGPLTGIVISIAAIGEDGPLEILELVVEYEDGENQLQVSRQARSNSFTMNGHIGTAPIGVFFLVMAKVKTIRFAVKTFGTEKENEITIPD